MNSLPRCVVTGAGGFIGSNMVAFLKERGHYVRAVDIQFPEFRKELWSQADERAERDLRQRDDFDDYDETADALFEGGDYDWVFHLAADMGGVGYFHSEADQQASRNNMQIDLNILEALKPEQRMFFSSSFCAYPTTNQMDAGRAEKLSETLLGGGPADALYGEEKRLMALLCNKTNTRVGLLNTVYGPYQEYEGVRMKFPTAITGKVLWAKIREDGFRESPDHPGNMGIPPEKIKESIEIWGDGTQIRTFLYIQDALEKIYRVMEAEEYDGPVNISSDQEVTVKECADALCDYLKIDPNYVYLKDKPTGVLSRGADNSKFNSLYGEVSQTPAVEGFKKLADWMSKQLETEANKSSAQQ